MTSRQKLSVFGFVVITLSVFGGLGYWGYKAYIAENEAKWAEEKRINDEKASETWGIVRKVASKLAEDTEGKDKFRHAHNPLPWNDAWGNPLHVKYDKPWFKKEKLTVSSAGPDQKHGTNDDITEERSR